MRQLEKGQTVYAVAEKFRDIDYIARSYYDVVKCKVDLVPRQGLREYRLLSESKPIQVLFRTRANVFETYAGALEVAKAEADREDARNKMYKINKRTYRPWERQELIRKIRMIGKTKTESEE